VSAVLGIRMPLTENKILGGIYGPIQDTGQWRIRYKTELYNLLKEPELAAVTRMELHVRVYFRGPYREYLATIFRCESKFWRAGLLLVLWEQREGENSQMKKFYVTHASRARPQVWDKRPIYKRTQKKKKTRVGSK
jgi:hypothetical protein